MIREDDTEILFSDIGNDPIEGLIYDLKVAQKFKKLYQENAEFREYINNFSVKPGSFV